MIAGQLPVRGNLDVLTVKATLVANHDRGCPARIWIDARPAARPDIADWWPRREPWPFLLGAITDAITAIDNGTTPDEAIMAAAATTHRKTGQPLHPGARNYLRQAVANYLDVAAGRAQAAAGGLRQTDPREIDLQNRALTCWALHYDNPDRTVREIRRLRLNIARGQFDGDVAWASVAAKLAVDGVRQNHVVRDPDPQRVVVVEVGLGDGSEHVIFDGDATAARAFYDTTARPRIAALTTDTRTVAGRDCGGCGFLAACPAVPVARGLLGLPEQHPMTRSVSASDLDSYARCPAQYATTRVFYLPRDQVVSTAQQRGLAVHRWLAAAHKRDDAGCHTIDFEADHDPLGVLSDHEWRIARRYLRQHVEYCPLGYDGLAAFEVEPTHYVFDPDADVVVAANPDLTFIGGYGPVWRETKSTDRDLPADQTAVLHTYTAAALDLVMLAALTEATTGSSCGTVELEVLAPEDSELYVLEADNPVLLAEARRVIAAAAYRWNTDVTYAATPAREAECDWCPVQRWCDGPQSAAAEAPAPARDLDAELPADLDDPPF